MEKPKKCKKVEKPNEIEEKLQKEERFGLGEDVKRFNRITFD